ncbi:MAG: hypothetical protein ABI661_06530 [Gammaproteobacteria bacterium]
MAQQKDPRDGLPTPALQATGIDRDADFAGYDPYIVAITGGNASDRHSEPLSDADASSESRKVQLMAWLRENGA